MRLLIKLNIETTMSRHCRAFLTVAVLLVGVIGLAHSQRPPRCADVENRVQCGYPGITKRKCLQDCNCCFDASAEDGDANCFYKVAPAKQSCCSVAPKRRVACRVKGHQDLDLDEEPYLCRRLGCCYDGGNDGDDGGYDDDDEGYGSRGGHHHHHQQHNNHPRCFQTANNCCTRLHPDDRVDAALTEVNKRQCNQIPGTCFSRRDEPCCYFKFAPCRCQVSSERIKPCSHDPDVNIDPVKCLQAGCCFDFKNKCYKPAKRSRSIELVDELEGEPTDSDPDWDEETSEDGSDDDLSEDDHEPKDHVLLPPPPPPPVDQQEVAANDVKP